MERIRDTHEPVLRRGLIVVALLGLGCGGEPAGPDLPDYTHEEPLQNVPFQGPGVVDGVLVPGQDEYWVAVTLITVTKNERSKPIRDHWTRSILAGIDDMPGHVGHRITVHDEEGKGWGIEHRSAWTYTVWTDQDALDGFVASNLHTEGLSELGPVITNFFSGRWTAGAAVIPEDWDEDGLWDRLERR